MSDLLLLRLPAHAGEPVQWLATSTEGMALASPQSGTLAEAAPFARGKRVCCLLGGADVLVTQVELPRKGGAKASQVAAYALEEQIVGDVEQLHVAVGKRNEATQRTPVAAVSRELMRGWLAQLADAGIVPTAMVAESSLLPTNPGQCVGLLETGQLILAPAGGSHPPVTLPADDLLTTLKLALPEESTQALHLLLYVSPAEWRERQQQFEQLRAGVGSLNVQVLNGGAMPWLATQVSEPGVINLLQGEFAPSGTGGGDWRRWRVAAALAVAALFVHGAAQIYQRSRLSHAEAEIDQQLKTLDQRYFEGTSGTEGLRKAVEQRLLGGGGGDARFLPALQAIAVAGAGSGTSLESLNFGEQSLRLRLLAPNADSIEQLAQKLNASGWHSEVLSGAAHGQQFESQLEIRMGKS